jgi:hypothetical protein
VSIIVGLAVLFGFCAAVYILFAHGWKMFAALDVQVKTLAGTASLVALLCAFIIADGIKARGHADNAAMAARAATYEGLLSLCCDQWKRASGVDLPESDGPRFIIERNLALHGSPEVIAAYVKLRRVARQNGKPDDALLKILTKEMRADLRRNEIIRKQAEVIELLLDQG